MESDIRTLSLGGGMTEDIEHMAEISEAMRLDRLVKKVDVTGSDEDVRRLASSIEDIRLATASSFKNTLQHAALEFGQLTLRVDDCSAVWFKEVVAK